MTGKFSKSEGCSAVKLREELQFRSMYDGLHYHHHLNKRNLKLENAIR